MHNARLVTACLLFLLFIGALLLLPNIYWGGLLLAGLFLASMEWGALAGYHPAARFIFSAVVMASGLLLFYGMHFGSIGVPGRQFETPIYLVSALFWAVLAPPWLREGWHVRNGLLLGAAGWIVLVPTWLALAALQSAAKTLLMLLAIVWIADTAAYVAGRRLGRHRLAPRISPGKTWEGVVGAGFAVAVYYVVVWFIFGAGQPLLQWPGGPILFVLVTAMSIEGDLFESWMKRKAGVKDSGTLFPGHGGVLDRIDGLTATVPVIALWLYYCGHCKVF